MGLVAQLGHYYDFITTRTGFPDLVPERSLVNPPNLCLANPGTEYVVYAPSGGSITVDLSAAETALDVEWLDPRTGTYKIGASVDGGEVRRFAAPDDWDWVLHLTRRHTL